MRPESLPSGPNISIEIEGQTQTSEKHFVARSTGKVQRFIDAEDWTGLFDFCHRSVFDLLRDVYKWRRAPAKAM